MSIHSPDEASGRSPDEASGHSPDEAPGHFPDEASGHSPDEATGAGILAELRTLDLFGGLDVAELSRLASHCVLSAVAPGHKVQAQGMPVRQWHVIAAGHALVRRNGVPIGLLGRGDSWSEHSILNEVPSTIAVVALSPLTLVTLDIRHFLALPDALPVLSGRLIIRAAVSADRLAPPVFNALVRPADMKA